MARAHRDPVKIGRPGYRVTRERLAGYQAAANAATPQPAALGIYEVAVNSREEGHRAALALLIAATRGELGAGDLVHLAPWQLITRDSTGSPPPS